ncbi:MAG: FtsK/SpoIIIE domain-containing protein [Candidatus Woesearchaeota archaeon]
MSKVKQQMGEAPKASSVSPESSWIAEYRDLVREVNRIAVAAEMKVRSAVNDFQHTVRDIEDLNKSLNRKLNKNKELEISKKYGLTVLSQCIENVYEAREAYSRYSDFWSKEERYVGIGCGIGCLSFIISSMVAAAYRSPSLFFVLIFVFTLISFVVIITYKISLKIMLQKAEDELQKTLLQETKSVLIKAAQSYSLRLQQTVEEVNSILQAWHNRCRKFLERVEPWIRDWGSPAWSSWEPVQEPVPAIRIGELRRVIKIETEIPERLQVAGRNFDLPIVKTNFSEEIKLPALIPFRGGNGLLVMADRLVRGEAIQAIQSLGFRLLAGIPPGKLRFVFIDPVGLGRNVASLFNLKDYDASEEESLVTFRVWTEDDHIRQKLRDLKEHIAIIIQERLRDQYPNIEVYNQEAGEVAVPYHILMVFDFPTNFNNVSARDLVSVAQSGVRVGVYPIVLMDLEGKLPYEFKIEELAQFLTTIVWGRKVWRLEEEDFKDWILHLDSSPPDDLSRSLIRRWGEKAKEGMRVEVPFGKLLEAVGLRSEVWWGATSQESLEVPLGPITARKMQHLELGKGTLNHGLIVGRTGSGKSNLMHIIITTAALKYPPDELRLYLIDLKTVEFTVYRELPHAEAVAVDADREFALSVLEGLNQEMHRRMEAFRSVAANDLAEYRDKTRERLPRILLIVDEFQVLFERDDQIAQEATRLLDRLVRQGRAFGIHVLLGSQSLIGSALPRSIIDQMAVRIALQCSETDSRLVLAEDNPAARRLSRPGQAIYNSRNGLIEGNTEFQVALFSDEDRERYIQLLLQKARKEGWDRRPIVFEGNEPARLESCLPLRERLHAGAPVFQRVVETWIGESVSIRPPVAIRWMRRSGNHLAVVTREEEEGVGVLVAIALGLVVQYPPARLQVCIANFSSSDAQWNEVLGFLQAHFSPTVRIIGRRELLTVLQEWHDVLQQSIDTGTPLQEDRYLFLIGLHRIRDLRVEEDLGYEFGLKRELTPAERLATLLREGPEMGIHVVFWCDTVANLRRNLDRRALIQIGFRVAGAMSEQDSTEFIDSPEAARLDKPHRMVFYDDERPGVLEKFRPYILKNLNWLHSIRQQLQRE